ncbi:zinc-dependent metalloprotease [Streptomyces phaeochromogenes]|uniref:zinc-dependent metalloprotease n=1 Tax=Streptomyces phaeochromogenes TaxID=1923 RepID=UPI00386AAF86|nr:zinc-dependent metalloprotease [Streptomyces phaeochromogenes]
MTSFTVHDDTRRHDELRERISEILHKVAPDVDATTSLPLPAHVCFRLLTPKAWRHAQVQHAQRILARDIADLDLGPGPIGVVRIAMRETARVTSALTWPLKLATSMEADGGAYETLMAPKALRHAGVLAHEPSLLQVVAHELVHHLQFAAADGTLWTTLFPHLRGIDPRSVTTFREGHAAWTDRHITGRLFGAPVDHRRDGSKSWRYRLHNGLPGIRRLGPSLEAYDRGARFFADVTAATGTDVVNRVWKDATLHPAAGEFADAHAWIGRVADVERKRGLDHA